jgi:SPX domain protein involved in polyphosphate accumulation
MVFSSAFRAAKSAEFDAAGAYLDYQAMKAVVHSMRALNDPTTPDTLFAALSEELRRTHEWCVATAERVTTACVSLMRAAVDDSVADPRGDADALMQALLRFQEVRSLNADALQRVLSRYARGRVLPPEPRWRTITDGKDSMAIPLDEALFALSKVYEVARGDATTAPADSAEASQDFVRRSVKFWVHQQDLPFVVARIVQHLPLSMMHDRYAEAKAQGAVFRLGSPVSSVYLENSRFLFYHRRLERLEGSTLIRIRWYGGAALTDDTTVYVEMKVHHEAWSGMGSSKRRFGLRYGDVDAFLSGRLSLNPIVEKMKGRGASAKEIAKFRDLAVDVLAKVQAYQLSPVLRSSCTRAAFQRGDDQRVRVSIDSELAMSCEDFGVSKHWRRRDDVVEGPEKTLFPFVVVEVKLQCAENERIAPWIEELLTCRFMEAVPKFSKYAHGIAQLFGHSHRIDMVPYWLSQLATDIRAATKHDGGPSTRGLAVGWLQRLQDSAVFGEVEAQTKTLGGAAHVFLPPMDDASCAVVAQVFGQPQLSCAPLHARHAAYADYGVWEPEAEAGCCGESHEESARARLGDIPWQTAKRVRVPQRFDPKTFLASERYFLRWVQNATQLGATALGVIHFGGGGVLPIAPSALFWDGRVHVAVGVAMMGCAVLALFYALTVLNARSLRVYARQKVRFDDVVGPALLTAIMVAGLVVVFFEKVTHRFGPLLSHSSDF